MTDNPWGVRVYRQDARYEQQVQKIMEVLDGFRKFNNPSPTWDTWTAAVNIMSQLELFFFDEFERERKARKHA